MKQNTCLDSNLQSYEFEICVALISAFISAWLLGHGVPSRTAISFCLLFTCQCFIGSYIWSWICRYATRPILESISMGYVIASTLTTVVDQFLISWGSRYEFLRVSTIIFTILIIARRRSLQNFQNSPEYLCQYLSWIFFVFSFVVLGRNSLTYSWLIVFSICFSTAVLLAARRNLIMNRSVLTSIFTLVSSFGFIFYNWHPSLKYGADLLFPLFSGTDDLIHSEATSNSLIHFGPWNSLSAPGFQTSYHWFSLAFTGGIKAIIDAEPFVVTLHIAPLIGLLIIGMLMTSIIFSISNSYAASIIGLFVGIATTTIPLGARVIQDLNPTNVVSYFWSLAAVLTCLLFLTKSIRFGIPIITIFASLCFLSKVPHGCVLYVAIIGMLIFAIRSQTLRTRTALALITSLTSSYLLTFLLLMKPMPWQDRSFIFLTNSSHLAVGSRLYPLIPIGAIFIFAISRFPIFSVTLWKKFDAPQKCFIAMTLAGSLASLVRFVVLGASSEFYFLNMGLMFSSLGFGCYIGVLLRETTNYFKIILLVQFLFALMSILFILRFFDNRFNGVPLLVLPFLGVLVSSILFIFFASKLISIEKFLIVFCSLITAGSIGVSFGSYFNTAFSIPHAEFTSNVLPLDEIVGLDFLRSVSSFNDVVATNRNLCVEGYPCDQNETHQIITAFTNRAVLIEGPRFLNGARNYPAWADERIDLSVNFAMNPTEVGKVKLLNFGVKWFYLFKNTPSGPINGHKIESISKLVFENATIAIYDLSSELKQVSDVK